MSRQINQPINQVRLTNVAVVRMNKGGKRFEIACYRNKVVDYRQGLETDLSEVLQTERVFTNVSKGEFSKAKDLQKVFGTKDEEEIAKLILQKGQVQVSEKERSQQLENTNAKVAEWISKNCVHPKDDRPYTITQIRHAMQQANFSVHPTKPLKRQYLDCVKLLQGIIPIQRAKMELLVVTPQSGKEQIEQILTDNNVTWNDDDEQEKQTRQYKILVDPSMYRVLNEVVAKLDEAKMEIISQIVTKQGDVKLEAEVVGSAANNDNSIQSVNDKLEELALSNQQSHPITSEEKDIESEDDDDEDIVMSRRKQQKKARKKNKKAKRRGGAEPDTSGANKTNVSTPSLQNPAATPATTSIPMSNGGGASDERKSCNTCGGFFDSAAAYRAHFKSDWHRFNQKLKMKGVAPISEQEFLACDSDTFFGSNDDGLMM